MESKTWPFRSRSAPALGLVLGVLLLGGCAEPQAEGPLLPVRLHERGVSSTLVMPALSAPTSAAAGDGHVADHLLTRRDRALGVLLPDQRPIVSESTLRYDLDRSDSHGRIRSYNRAEERSVIIRRR